MSGAVNVWVMNANGSGQTNLTNNVGSGVDAEPNRSPDGSKLTFNSFRDGEGEIFVMNANGSGVTQLTFNGATEFSPAWSPEGIKIAFESNRDGNFEVYVMNADGSGQTRLTNSSGLDGQPRWQRFDPDAPASVTAQILAVGVREKIITGREFGATMKALQALKRN